MSLLTIVQQFCLGRGLSSPPVVATATDAQTKQILAILNDLLDMVRSETKFQGYDIEKTWTTLAAQDQGALATVAGTDWEAINNMTIFNRTLNTPVLGPLSDVEWQSLKAASSLGPYQSYRIRANHLYLYPTPTAGHTLGFEYQSKYGVLSSLSVLKQYFTADDDTAVLPEHILRKGLSFLWKREKGFPYQAEEIEYYKLLNNFIVKDGTKRAYNLAAEVNNTKPTYPNPWIPSVPA